ncbi:MAG: hypothetical protein Q8928_18810 [Bacteroidota bacterium]|nr:hypothetical protein [Bacteroidota bacterium]
MEIIEPDQTFSQPTPAYLQPVPYFKAVLFWGISSLLVCWWFVGLGLVLEIITLVLAGKGKGIYQAQPLGYIKGSYRKLKIGEICAIAGIGLSILSLVFLLIRRILVGAFFSLFSGYDFISSLFPRW